MSALASNTIFIDAIALVPERKSGVGMTIHNTLKNLTSIVGPEVRICLVVPLGKAKHLKSYRKHNVDIKTIPMPARVMEVLLRTRLMPPLDWFLGKGIYVFPNYRNWPLWKSRSLTYIYDLGFLLFPETLNPKNRRYLNRYIRRWTNRTDKIVTISEQVRNEIEKHMGIYAQKIAIVPCGVDRTHYKQQSAKSIVAVKKKYGIHFDKYILFVGNIEPRKNLNTLLKAYELLPEKIQDSHGLVIVGGDGWLNREVMTQLEDMKTRGLQVMKVQKYVSVDDLASVYSGAELLAHPAVYEGFGMTPLEALACGTPVVVADTPAMHEVVGDAGYYTDPSDPDDLKNTLQRALELPRNRLAAVAAEQVRLYSWHRSAEALLQAIDEQRAAGFRRAVPLMIAKQMYQTFDLRLRSMLGEKPLSAYNPNLPKDIDAAYDMVVADFIAEQPTFLQTVGLKAYLGARRTLAAPLKVIIRSLRGSS